MSTVEDFVFENKSTVKAISRDSNGINFGYFYFEETEGYPFIESRFVNLKCVKAECRIKEKLRHGFFCYSNKFRHEEATLEVTPRSSTIEEIDIPGKMQDENSTYPENILVPDKIMFGYFFIGMMYEQVWTTRNSFYECSRNACIIDDFEIIHDNTRKRCPFKNVHRNMCNSVTIYHEDKIYAANLSMMEIYDTSIIKFNSLGLAFYLYDKKGPKVRLSEEKLNELVSMFPEDNPIIEPFRKKLMEIGELYEMSEQLKYSDEDSEVFIDMCNPNNIMSILSQLNESKDIFRKKYDIFTEYCYMKMKEIMEMSRFIRPENISSCFFISVRIIKEYPRFKWRWDLISQNLMIPLVDIFENNNLPWIYEIVAQRSDMTVEFAEHFGIKTYINKVLPSNKDKSTLFNYINRIDKFQIPVYSVEECDVQSIIDNPNNIDIEYVINKLNDEFPEYMELQKDNMKDVLTEIRKNIFENNGFDINNFTFPEKFPDNGEKANDESEVVRFVSRFDCEPTQEDPYGIRLALQASAYEGKEYIISKVGSHHFDKTPKNREEYVELLKTFKVSKFNLEKFVFFEAEDLINFPRAFDTDTENVFGQSGKLTLDLLFGKTYCPLTSNKEWSLKILAKYLPFDWVFENLLFYGNRLKFDFIYDNYQQETDLDKLRKIYKSQDVLVMSIITSRRDANEEYILQYPNLSWDKTIKPFINVFSRGSNNKPSNESDTKPKIKTFNDALTTNFDYICKLADIDVKEELNEKERESLIVSIFRNIKFQNTKIIEPIMKRHPGIKWNVEFSIDLNDLFKFHKENGHDLFISMYLLIICSLKCDKCYFDFSKSYMDVVKTTYEQAENKSEVYNWFISSLSIMMQLYKVFIENTKTPLEILLNKQNIFIEVSDIFKNEDIANSLYTYPLYYIEKYGKLNKLE